MGESVPESYTPEPLVLSGVSGSRCREIPDESDRNETPTPATKLGTFVGSNAKPLFELCDRTRPERKLDRLQRRLRFLQEHGLGTTTGVGPAGVVPAQADRLGRVLAVVHN